MYSSWMRTRPQSWKCVQSAECAARFRMSIQHVGELERVEHGRLAGQYDAETYALSRWQHKRHGPLHAFPETVTLCGIGYIGGTGGYATYGNLLGRRAGCQSLDLIETN